MKNQFGVPVPGWTVLATAFGGAFFALSVIAATVGDFAPIVLLAVGPIAFLGVGLAIRAYVATAESRRQTEVVRAVFGYGRGELLASWHSHLWRIAFFGVAVVWFATSALLGDERYLWGNVVCSGYLWGLFTVSAVQKWRYERRPRGAYPRPEVKAVPREVSGLPDLPPKPVRGARRRGVGRLG